MSETARPDVDTHDEAYRRNIERVLVPDDDSYFARMVRGNTLRHRDWLDAEETRHHMRFKWAEFFKDYDILLCPVAASASQPHDFKGERYQRTVTINGRAVSTMDRLFWAAISTLIGLPATPAPIGLTPSGLPVGVQTIGPGYVDLACIAFAELLEKEYRGFAAPPGYED